MTLSLPPSFTTESLVLKAQLFTNDQAQQCDAQEYVLLPGLPETLHRSQHTDDRGSSYTVLVPTNYFSPKEIADGISGRVWGGSDNREDRIKLYQSIALELALKSRLEQTDYYEFEYQTPSVSNAADGRASDVFENFDSVRDILE